MAKYGTIAICMLVALRLATGWHFYNEGMKKLEPGFSSEGFLRGAKGPMAPLYQSVLTGPHDAAKLLGQPRPYHYDAAVASKPIDESYYAAWLERIELDWDQSIQRLSRLLKDDDLIAAVRSSADSHLAQIVTAIEDQGANLESLDHESWRLEQLREEATDKPTAFMQTRVDDKSREVSGLYRSITSPVVEFENRWIEDVVRITDGAASENRVRAALAERTSLVWIDFAVTCVVLGVGVCLFLGLLTPVAGVVGALFLFSVMSTQPPWVAGAATDNLFYILVEAMALLVLAATSAGQWAGLDGLYMKANRYFNYSKTHESLPPTPAEAA
ncbi:hypothetical protein Mal64_37140 [Pseudobythopirellula maris]|uniref:DoxX n=1 Tax=Pseudobythopirellula maris TaxID=2527991 RepID=A0A5C5ZHQ6_9BACT|nr:DoxX family protein [Pseudobythopirellula maris]TWT86884.1 hypothetical protein Mal64_37140 [Pseudobythopirellula maris]